MMRGCQKQVIHIRDTDSRVFEEAYVVLRPGADGRQSVVSGDDMIREAERLVRESLGRVYPSGSRRRKRRPFLLPFLGGAAAASAVFVLALLLRALL